MLEYAMFTCLQLVMFTYVHMLIIPSVYQLSPIVRVECGMTSITHMLPIGEGGGRGGAVKIYELGAWPGIPASPGWP